ncbi:hypothetical protein HCB37_10205 [Listeria booriae]|nr:hypothetical protein [Listeria booriae]
MPEMLEKNAAVPFALIPNVDKVTFSPAIILV